MEARRHTWHEIFSQPEAWSTALTNLDSQAEALRNFYRAGRFERVLFTACGSPFYLGQSAAAWLKALGIAEAQALPASEVWLNPRLGFRPDQKTLLIALSRSGETSETLHAVETFRAQGQGSILTLTINLESALTTQGDMNIVLPEGREESLAQTRAFTTLYLGTLYLGALWGNRSDLLNELAHLPSACQSILVRYQALAQVLGHNPGYDRFYFLGSGALYGLACELSLKIKEMSLSHSEAFHFLEFRHGPKSMAGPGALVLGLVSETHQSDERAVLRDIRALGADVVALGEHQTEVAFQSGLSESTRTLLYLPFGQLLALERALSKGLNPDKPANLEAVVVLA